MTDGALPALLRRDRAVVLSGLAAVVVLAWAYLLVGAGIKMEMMDMGGGQMMAMPPEWTLGYGATIMTAHIMKIRALPIERGGQEDRRAIISDSRPASCGALAVRL